MEPTKLICKPWADLTTLPDMRPAEETDDAEWERLLWQASEILWALSGRQFSGECESAVTLRGFAHGSCYWGLGGWPADDWVRCFLPRGGSGGRVVALPDPPVTAITSVTIDGDDVDPDTYVVTLPAGLIEHTGHWPADGTLEIVYTHGIGPDLGGTRSAVLLARELSKAYRDDGDCKLPQRIQTLSREGVTVGFQDDFGSLDKVRTGLYAIDLWLASVNPRGIIRRARVWTPELARARRRTTT